MKQDYQTPGVLASGDHPRVRVHVRRRVRSCVGGASDVARRRSRSSQRGFGGPEVGA